MSKVSFLKCSNALRYELCLSVVIYLYALLRSIYMQAIDWLLEVKAIPFTERALGIQLLHASREGGPTADFHIAMARLKLQKRELQDAEEELNDALQLDYQVACLPLPLL